MRFRIIRPSHSHIGGEVSFYLIKQDPYERYKTIERQLFKATTPEYHLDYFGRFPEYRSDPSKFAEKKILEELQQKFKELLLSMNRQIDKDTILVWKDGTYKEEPLGFFSIE